MTPGGRCETSVPRMAGTSASGLHLRAVRAAHPSLRTVRQGSSLEHRYMNPAGNACPRHAMDTRVSGKYVHGDHAPASSSATVVAVASARCPILTPESPGSPL